MSDPNVDVIEHEVTLESLAQRLDIIGNQLNWMTENLQSLFAFVNQMGQNGGGIRGLMHVLKQGKPELTVQHSEDGGSTNAG